MLRDNPIIQKLISLDLPKDDFAVFGSGPMFAHGIKDLGHDLDVVFDVDTWPMIDPFLEIEGPDDNSVKEYFQKLGFDFNKAVFGSSDVLYKDLYNIDILKMPKLTFN